jgi:hypothetical protein
MHRVARHRVDQLRARRSVNLIPHIGGRAYRPNRRHRVSARARLIPLLNKRPQSATNRKFSLDSCRPRSAPNRNHRSTVEPMAARRLDHVKHVICRVFAEPIGIGSCLCLPSQFGNSRSRRVRATVSRSASNTVGMPLANHRAVQGKQCVASGGVSLRQALLIGTARSEGCLGVVADHDGAVSVAASARECCATVRRASELD